MKRYDYIDVAKIIGIWLVVLGHYTYAQNIVFKNNNVWHLMFIVTLFHMPLFFIISGMLYKPINFKDTIKKGWIQLIIPYLIMAFLGLFIEFCLNDFNFIVLLKGLLGIISANDLGNLGTLSYTRPIWFLYSLFIVKILMVLTKKKYWIGIMFCLIGIFFLFIGNKMLFRIDSSFIGFLFFYVGYLCKNWFVNIDNSTIVSLFYFICINFIILYFIGIKNINYSIPQGAMSINMCRGGEYPILFIISGISGTWLILSISSIITKFLNLKNKSFIRFLSFGSYKCE